MGMPEDADIWMFMLQECPPFFRQLPPFIQNMTNGDTEACQFDYSLRRKYTLFTVIDVAGDGGDRRDQLQLLEDGSLANISGVEYMIDVSEVLHDR